jgi:hypothetical protein
MDMAVKPILKNGMDSIRDFRNALADMEQILTDMGTMTGRTDSAWRLEYVELRRQLQLQIAVLGAAAQQYGEVSEQSGLAAELRKRLNGLRSALALHQANWPVVSIDAKNPGYAESSNNIHVAAVSFGKLARKFIAASASA